jgi:hypothetical protein
VIGKKKTLMTPFKMEMMNDTDIAILAAKNRRQTSMLWLEFFPLEKIRLINKMHM